MLLSMALLHALPGLKRLNYECQICMPYCRHELWMSNVYALLLTILETHQWTMPILNILESCGFGRLRSIQEVQVCTYPEEFIILRLRQECPVDPLPHPGQSDWRTLDSVVWVHRSLPSSLFVTTNEESLYQRCVSCDRVASCVTHCLEIQNQMVFLAFCISHSVDYWQQQ
jgi:hypothetical protein